MYYRIAINKMSLTGKLAQGDPRWGQFNDSFVNQDLTVLDIANSIFLGHAYAAWHDGRRKDENFLCAQHIAVDMESHDERSSIDYLRQQEFIQMYAGLIHTTPSHTDADPRCRIIFFLDEPITDAIAYETAIGFIYSLFPGSDTACVDSSRFFYGAKDCQLELWQDNVLPMAHLRTFYNRWRRFVAPQEKPAQPQQAATHRTTTTKKESPGGILTPDVFVDYAINDSTGEGRNKRGYRLARQLKELGLTQFEAEPFLRKYQQQVATKKDERYTEKEAMVSLKSAYSRPARAH